MRRLIVLTAATTLVAACNAAGYGTGPSNGNYGTGAVTIGASSFSPSNVRPDGNGHIVWTWGANVTHNIVFEDTTIAGSGSQSSGSFTRTFTTPGSYRFRCTIHSTSFTNGMHGVVLLGTSAPPDTGSGGYGYP